MEDINVVRQSSLRPSGAYKSTSGRSTPRGSPSFRRLNSGRTPRRDGRGGGIVSSQWFRSNRIVLWLLLITLWAYAGFYVQSRWAHGDNKEGIFGGYDTSEGKTQTKEENWQDLISDEDRNSLIKVTIEKNRSNTSNNLDVVLAQKASDGGSARKSLSMRKKGKRSPRSSRRKSRGKQRMTTEVTQTDADMQEEEIPKTNATYGLLVGPFASIEDNILEWSPEKRSGTCYRNGQFARLVWSRKFVLIFHELSMTGAPLAMMELATELLSCGATVSVVVLSKKGGLMPELLRRKINVLEDKLDLSFKTAMKADLIIAGSAVCSSWIEKYREHTVLGASQIAWWIMENRREYFDRSKLALGQVKKLIFLSESQAKQWLAWCEEEKIKLNSEPALLPLSVNDELAFVAGIDSSLNTPLFSIEKMLEKRQVLRDTIRQEMGLTDNDMLVLSLSSINPGKGQYLLLKSAQMIVQGMALNYSRLDDLVERGQDYHARALLQKSELLSQASEGLDLSRGSSAKTIIEEKRESSRLPRLLTIKDKADMGISDSSSTRKLLSGNEGAREQKLKVLIGSVGSKSNKVPYVKALLSFLSQHSDLSKSVMWTPATTRVASLYAAADAYVMNSQGIGETFGRVTIEAMAFGLPVMGTDSGGTREIVEHNVTGLLHPLGRPGAQILAKNLQFLLKNPSARQKMGIEGRKKVEKMYLKKHMYQKFGEILYSCLRIK